MKQRLIDANKLKRTEGMFQYQINDAFDRLSASAYRFEDVENAPTVEAIPVEWIKHYKSISGLITYSTLNDLLRTMLNDWEKENGSNR